MVSDVRGGRAGITGVFRDKQSDRSLATEGEDGWVGPSRVLCWVRLIWMQDVGQRELRDGELAS